MARLELVFGSCAGRTFIREQFVSNPLKILRPFDLKDGRVLLQLLNVGPGILANDVFKLSIKLEPGAKVFLVNQSATKLHSMKPGEQALQEIAIDLAENAELEYYPGLSIPFRNTYFEQSIQVHLDSGAKFAFLERWAMGRIAFGERFLFQELSSQLKLYQDAQLRYADALKLSQSAAQLGATDDFNYLATGVWCWDELPQSSTSEPIRGLSPKEDVFLCEAFGNGTVYVRALANDGLTLGKQTNRFISGWREQAGLGRLEFNRFLS